MVLKVYRRPGPLTNRITEVRRSGGTQVWETTHFDRRGGCSSVPWQGPETSTRVGTLNETGFPTSSVLFRPRTPHERVIPTEWTGTLRWYLPCTGRTGWSGSSSSSLRTSSRYGGDIGLPFDGVEWTTRDSYLLATKFGDSKPHQTRLPCHCPGEWQTGFISTLTLKTSYSNKLFTIV